MAEGDDEIIPMPPDEYIALVCGPIDDGSLWFTAIGKEFVKLLGQHGMLGDGVRLLDVGCGCGRVARYLVNGKVRSYLGFDRHPGMIDWCNDNIAKRFPEFEFKFFNIESAYSAVDGYTGEISAVNFKFPFPDAAFDSVLLASVFTHMPLVQIKNYLEEIHRVLTPSGTVLLTVFFSDTGGEAVTQDINFWLSQEQFMTVVHACNFDAQLIGGWEPHWLYRLQPSEHAI